MFFKSLKQLRETKEKDEWKKVPMIAVFVCLFVYVEVSLIRYDKM